MKNALVTGGSGGIGSAVCRTLAREGYAVTIGYRGNEAAALALAAEIGGQAVRADLAVPEEAERLCAAAGDVELLVNCAGVAWDGLLQDMTEAEWRHLFAVNVDGMFRCSKLVIPAMVRRQSGCIINISSVLGVSGGACETAYSATKGAVISFTHALAMELGPSGIRVNCICPGCIDTPMLDVYTAEEKLDLIDRTALGRLGTGEDVAETAAFLASDRASFITGQTITVDGGFMI